MGILDPSRFLKLIVFSGFVLVVLGTMCLPLFYIGVAVLLVTKFTID